MGKVSAFFMDGLELIFYSADHWPPHFHVRKAGEWEIRVFFIRSSHSSGLDYDVKWSEKSSGPSRTTLKELLEKTLANKAALLEEWEAKVDY